MASLLTHPVVPIAIAIIAGRKLIPLPVLLLGILFAILPDADSVTFRLGIPYASPFGHRGFSHSICCALAFAIAAVPLSRRLDAKPVALFLFLFASMLSHGVLDAMTNKGNGVAFFWPFSAERFFFGFHPIEASPVSVRRFLSECGIEILQSELKWVWMPLLVLTLFGYGMRKKLGASKAA
jgi:inner membrane protein